MQDNMMRNNIIINSLITNNILEKAFYGDEKSMQAILEFYFPFLIHGYAVHLKTKLDYERS